MKKHKTGKLQKPSGVRLDDEFGDLVGRALTMELEHRYGARCVPAQGGKTGLVNQEIRDHPYMQSVDWERIEKRAAVAPEVPEYAHDEANRRHRHILIAQEKVPGLPVKRPSPRLECLDVKAAVKESPRRKRRLGGHFSMCLPPSEKHAALV
ncbi:hypothetical protein BD413DRAFT_6467 [Trametes elegans]|nr:hypothetical protein BD413DRAFT_6467 [Trametes elegans]